MPAKKPKTYVGRVYLGQDENGRQLWHWVGRFELKRDREEAVARAKTEKPWLKDGFGPAAITVNEWADRYLARMESGALTTRGGRRYKHSSIDTARSSLRALRDTFGDRPLASITRVEAEDWAESVTPGKIPIGDHADERGLPRRADRPQPLRGPVPPRRRAQERGATV